MLALLASPVLKALMPSPKTIVRFGLGFAVGAFLVWGTAHHIGYRAGIRDGEARLRAEAVEETVRILKERSQTNAEVRDSGPDLLCRSLGGRMLSDGITCE